MARVQRPGRPRLKPAKPTSHTVARSAASIGALLARYYDLDLLDDPGDVDLYLALAARTDGPILELGAGSGRIAVPLAQAGHDVTAVDLDPDMLERAKAR